MVRRTVSETRRLVSDPATTWQPSLVGRNLYVLLDEEKLRGRSVILSADGCWEVDACAATLLISEDHWTSKLS